MPFHPRIEFVLNRVAILGEMASQELSELTRDEDAFERMLKLSVNSITDPKGFEKALKLEEREAKKKRNNNNVENKQPHKELEEYSKMTELLHFGAHEVGEEDDDEEDDDIIIEQEENKKVQILHEQEGEGEKTSEKEREELKFEKEAKRIRDELQKMTFTLLDTIRMSVDVIVKTNNNESKKKKQQGEEEKEKQQEEAIEEQEEPEVKITNFSLLRFVLEVLSDSRVASTFRVPLLQNDLPLLARSILKACCRCCSSSSEQNNNNNNKDDDEKKVNSIIFLLLDMIATMVSDSAACRVAFACCVSEICQVLEAKVSHNKKQSEQQKVNNNKTQQQSKFQWQQQPAAIAAAGSATTAKKPFALIDPTASSSSSSTSNSSSLTSPQNQQQNQQQNQEEQKSYENDDVIFAGTAAIEAMLFHCEETIESFLLYSDGVRIFVSLFRQISSQSQSNNNNKSEKDLESATDITSFIKRTLLHCRISGVVSEEKWNEILQVVDTKKKSNIQQQEGEKETTLANKTNLPNNNNNTKSSSPSSCSSSVKKKNDDSNSVFGRQGDNIEVDQLKWSLTGGFKLGTTKIH